MSRSRLRLGYSKLDKYTGHAKKQIIVDNLSCSTELTGQVRFEIFYPHVGQLCNTISTHGA